MPTTDKTVGIEPEVAPIKGPLKCALPRRTVFL